MPPSPSPPAKRIVRRRKARGANRLPMSPASETGEGAAATAAAAAAEENACLGVSSENPGLLHFGHRSLGLLLKGWGAADCLAYEFCHGKLLPGFEFVSPYLGEF